MTREKQPDREDRTELSVRRRDLLLTGASLFAVSSLTAGLSATSVQPARAQAAGATPNILVIWGDDIGIWNISHNNNGM
ncbi:arylsulfatase, partial [Rhizobiaceae sp. 2RAB30]